MRRQKTLTKTAERNISVDIRGHHALCEMNFFRMEKLMPAYKNGISSWSYLVGGNGEGDTHIVQMEIRVVDRAPYTTTVEITQTSPSLKTNGPQESSDSELSRYIASPKLLVRLYNDVKMAEIISWDAHRNWLPKYEYPNANMYNPDEKLELNRFLGDWLVFCRKQARISFNNCEQVLVCGK